MYVDSKKKRIVAVVLIILLLLLVPFGSGAANVYGCEITAYKAVLYTVVRLEAFGFTDTKFYFFPSNIDANNNLETSAELLGSLHESLNVF